MKKLTSSILMAITLVAGAATVDLASQSREDNAPRSIILASQSREDNAPRAILLASQSREDNAPRSVIAA